MNVHEVYKVVPEEELITKSFATIRMEGLTLAGKTNIWERRADTRGLKFTALTGVIPPWVSSIPPASDGALGQYQPEGILPDLMSVLCEKLNASVSYTGKYSSWKEMLEAGFITK